MDYVYDWGNHPLRRWGCNAWQQPHQYTTYERDGNASDEAMMRRYNRWHSRFDQPDPYDGSYDLADPQSLNRYSYTRGDPVNFIDPLGLDSTPKDGPKPGTQCDTDGDGRVDGIIGNDGKCYAGPREHVDVTNIGNPFIDPFFLGGTSLAGTGGGRGTGMRRGGVPEVRTPTRPQQQAANPEQQAFEDCARNAVKNWRRAEYPAIAKMGGGAVGATLSTVVGGRALNAIGGILSSGVKIVRFKGGYRALQFGVSGSVVGGIASGSIAWDGFNQTRANHAALDKAMADCMSRYSKADHTTIHIFATTW